MCMNGRGELCFDLGGLFGGDLGHVIPVIQLHRVSIINDLLGRTRLDTTKPDWSL